nr:group II intron maturase-specific domain-containing protein [Rhizobium leguminosarum]
MGASPSRKSVQRLKKKVSDLLVPGVMGTWPDVRNRLNRLLRGWSTYFGYGSRLPAYRAVDNHVYERVRNFLTRRHKVARRGSPRFSDDYAFGDGGVLPLPRVHPRPTPGAEL